MTAMPQIDAGILFQLAPMFVLLFGGVALMVAGAVTTGVGRVHGREVVVIASNRYYPMC